MSQALLVLGVILLCPPLGGARAEGGVGSGASQFFSDVWRVDDGLQQGTVTAVVQSRDGYLWLGTYHGLVRFDGVRFAVFDSSNTRGLKNIRVTSLYEDPDGVLWIGHETGELTRFSNGDFHSVSLATNWPGGAIETITTDERGDVWLLNDSGFLFRLRDGQSAGLAGGSSTSARASLTRQRNGKLWVVSNGAVATVEGGKLSPFRFDEADQAGFYQNVSPARDGGMWVLGNGRLRKWRDDRWIADLGECPCERGFVTVLLETRSGALLSGTVRDGLYLLAPGAEPLHFSRTNGLSHDWVRALCEDHEGNIWIGTGGGLDALRGRKVKMLNAPDDWQGRAILSFIVRPNGTAWIGTEGAGLYRYQRVISPSPPDPPSPGGPIWGEGGFRGERATNTTEWTRFGEASGLTNAFVWSVFETKTGALLVSTWGGRLLVKNGEQFESHGELSKITAPVLAMFEGRHGDLWIGTPAGLHRYEAGKLTWSAGKEKLFLPDVRSITESPDGTLWFGMSGGGLGSLKDGNLKQFRKEDGLSSDFILSLYADADGTLWIGTLDNGLSRLQRGKFSTISKDQGLASSVICNIVDDGAGNLWMGSRRGILRASKADLHRCADGQAKSIHCLSYGKAEGLASETCSGGFQPGACKTPDGMLWFPTTKGLAIVDPGGVTTNPVSPPVVIEELLVEGQAVELRASNSVESAAASTSSLRIPPDRQRFELRYTALSFTAPDKVRFKYKLEGLEEGWVDAGTKRLAQYSYLPPGAYLFRVIACNNDDVWNEKGASLAFTVLPHFWQTWWFRVAVVAGGASAVGAGVLGATRRRVRHKLEKLERQQAVERERARIARDIHDDLGASLTRITMLSQTVRSELKGEPQTAADVDQIYHTARELTRAMDEIVWAVNPKHDTVDSLVTYLGRFAQDFLSAAGIRCRLDVPLHLPPWTLTAEIRHNVFLAFKEALHNAVKHASASEVQISLELLADGFVLVVADNGCGFDVNGQKDQTPPLVDGARLSVGDGLLNMQKRLEEVGGRCEWDTAAIGQGTRVKLAIALKT